MKKALLFAAALLLLTGCATGNQTAESDEKLMIAAAASMETSMENDVIPAFEKQYGIEVEGTYDSSGKLQKQIENGLDADLFLSAAKKQMEDLKTEGYIAEDTDLLENKIVLISGGETSVTSFENINDAKMIAIGDPESVPAGQYAKEALENIGVWDGVSQHMSLGTNVTEVLNWVAQGSAEVGIVYATDAATADVKVIAEAPEGSLAQPVIYPLGILENAKDNAAAQKFYEFLQSDEMKTVFESYGFTVE